MRLNGLRGPVQSHRSLPPFRACCILGDSRACPKRTLFFNILNASAIKYHPSTSKKKRFFFTQLECVPRKSNYLISFLHNTFTSCFIQLKNKSQNAPRKGKINKLLQSKNCFSLFSILSNVFFGEFNFYLLTGLICLDV